MAAGNPAGWIERARVGTGPIYLGILRALEQAIREGELHPGDRLPSQRTVAQQLGVDLTTVTRAYGAARELGIVDGAVGRGTFVRARIDDDDAGLIDLSMNLPPPPEGLSLGELLSETTTAILHRSDPAALMAYHPGFGTLGQRLAGAQWLAPSLGEVSTDRILVAPGAQAALAAILLRLCRPGDTVVAEPLTYPGFIAAAAHLQLRVVPCATDDEGLVPEALRQVCEQERPKAIYAVPTTQNPTAATAGLDRRRQLAAVVRQSGAALIEDDPYARLLDAPFPALAALAPEATFHIGTLAKTLSPGLRIAYVACPDATEADRVAAALRAIALMPAPLMAAVATRWVREGVAERLLAGVRAEAVARRAIAAELLPAAVGRRESIHVWLDLASGMSGDRLRHAAEQRGLALVTDEAFAVAEPHNSGVRVSLGGPRRRSQVTSALQSLAELLRGQPQVRTQVV